MDKLRADIPHHPPIARATEQGDGSCAPLAGQHAAVKAGLGVTILPKDMVPAGRAAMERRSMLPDQIVRSLEDVGRL